MILLSINRKHIPLLSYLGDMVALRQANSIHGGKSPVLLFAFLLMKSQIPWSLFKRGEVKD